MPLLPLEAWHAEQLRLTVFTPVNAPELLVEWWEGAVGNPPEETTSNVKKGLSEASGPYAAGKLTLRFEPGRADWLLTPSIDAEEISISQSPPEIGELNPALEAFTDLALRWLARRDKLPQVTRMAFGAVLTHQEDDRQSGYRRLPDYVPVEVNPGASDFLFQINYPAPLSTGIVGLVINRLSKWSVAAVRRMAFRAVAGAGVPQSIVMAEPVYAFRLELDINTAPDFQGELAADQLCEVYRELVSAGIQIARVGLRQ